VAEAVIAAGLAVKVEDPDRICNPTFCPPGSWLMATFNHENIVKEERKALM